MYSDRELMLPLFEKLQMLDDLNDPDGTIRSEIKSKMSQTVVQLEKDMQKITKQNIKEMQKGPLY